jgi:hypothetical protein
LGVLASAGPNAHGHMGAATGRNCCHARVKVRQRTFHIDGVGIVGVGQLGKKLGRHRFAVSGSAAAAITFLFFLPLEELHMFDDAAPRFLPAIKRGGPQSQTARDKEREEEKLFNESAGAGQVRGVLVVRLVETASGSSGGLCVRRRCGQAPTVKRWQTNSTGEAIRGTLCGDRWGVTFLARRRPPQTARAVVFDVGENARRGAHGDVRRPPRTKAVYEAELAANSL